MGARKRSRWKKVRLLTLLRWLSILCPEVPTRCLPSRMDAARRRIGKECCWRVKLFRSQMGWCSVSHKLINHSPDLKRLRDEGYTLEIRSGFLLVKDVPYLNSRRVIQRGTLVSELTLAGDVTTRPGTHVAYLIGEYPCHKDGRAIERIKNQSYRQTLAAGLVIDHTFSAKPPSGFYENFYTKLTTYVNILSGPARAIDPTVTAQVFAPIESVEEKETVFNYIDVASSRAEIGSATEK